MCHLQIAFDLFYLLQVAAMCMQNGSALLKADPFLAYQNPVSSALGP